MVWLLILPAVFGITIRGTVYDFALNKLPNSVIEINSTPYQVFVAKDGTYSFSVPAGMYELRARHNRSDSEIVEYVVAQNEGDYVLDLILLPTIDSDNELLAEAEAPIDELIQARPRLNWLIWVVVFGVLGYIVYKVSKKPQKIVEKITEVVREVREIAIPEELQKIMDFIEKEGGRTTQKDIRKNFPYSEAKISLMIDELEAKGLIKKVKKGRGNLILKV